MTIRLVPAVVSLSETEIVSAVTEALSLTRGRPGVRICHFALVGNRIHFIIEANDRVALARAMAGIGVRIARRLNRVMECAGRVIADRYQVRALKTETEVRELLGELKRNAGEHGSWAHRNCVARSRTRLLRAIS